MTLAKDDEALVDNCHSAKLGSTTVATEVRLDARRTMAFASSILGDENDAYLDDALSRFPVHPAIAFSLQWASRHRIVEKADLIPTTLSVHADSDLRISRPFRVGEVVCTQGRLISRRRIGPRLHLLERYRMNDCSGNAIAELDFGTLSDGGVQDAELAEIEPTTPTPTVEYRAASPLWSVEISAPVRSFHHYTECARIHAPIHTEKSIARELGLPGIILHGSATKAIALSQVINRCFDGDSSRITRLCGQLRGMVIANTAIRVQCMGIDDRLSERVVSFRVLNERGQSAISNGFVVGHLAPGERE